MDAPPPPSPRRAAQVRPELTIGQLTVQEQRDLNALGQRCHMMRISPGGFNWSAQHLLILLDEEVATGDVTDIVHGEAEGRTLGALEERTKGVGHLPGAGKEEQDRRPADRGSQWRDRSGAASQGCGGVEA